MQELSFFFLVHASDILIELKDICNMLRSKKNETQLRTIKTQKKFCIFVIFFGKKLKLVKTKQN